MRVVFLLGIVAVVTIVLSALIFVGPKGGSASRDEPIVISPADAPQGLQPQIEVQTKVTEPATSRKSQAIGKLQGDAKDATAEEKKEARVEAHIAELQRLGGKTDRTSLERLMAELKNPEEEIRQAVLDALSQSGNRAAIPYLVEAAAQTEDAQEKKAIEDTIEFLKLPTLTEVLRQSATNR